ncbi:MAG: hypothetical protein H0U77_00810 [Nocardioidaceae bacterium]|nr:hypothetical protein [Nocardioidaceae bacterium]
MTGSATGGVRWPLARPRSRRRLAATTLSAVAQGAPDDQRGSPTTIVDPYVLPTVAGVRIDFLLIQEDPGPATLPAVVRPAATVATSFTLRDGAFTAAGGRTLPAESEVCWTSTTQTFP